MIRTFWVETGLDDKEWVSWMRKERKEFHSGANFRFMEEDALVWVWASLVSDDYFSGAWLGLALMCRDEKRREILLYLEVRDSKMTASSRGSRAAIAVIRKSIILLQLQEDN